MSKISRKKFVKAGIVGLGGLYLAPTSVGLLTKKENQTRNKSNLSPKILNIGINDIFNKDKHWLKECFQKVNQTLAQQSQNSLSINLTPATSEAIRTYKLDAYISSPMFWHSPVSLFMGYLPLPLSAEDKLAWLNQPAVQEIWSQYSFKEGFATFLLGATAGHSGLISTQEDLNNKNISKLKFAASRNLFAKNIRNLGGTVVPTSIGEIKSSLLDRKVDVSESLNHKYWLATSLHKEKQLYYYANEWSRTQIYHLMIKNDVWNRLDEVEKLVFTQAIQSISPAVSNKMDAEIKSSFLDIKLQAANKVQSASDLQKAMQNSYLDLAYHFAKKYPEVNSLLKSLESFVGTNLNIRQT